MLAESPALFYALLPVAGFAIGVFGSFTGLGGAIILTPALAMVFGLPYNTAVGCALAQMVGMAGVGLVRHYRLGHVDARLAINFLCGSIPGAVLGRMALREASAVYGMDGGLTVVFNVFYVSVIVAGIVSMVVKLARGWRRRGEQQTQAAKPARLTNPASRAAAVFAGGLGAGLLAGFFAIGGGIVTVPVLVSLLGVRVELAIGTSILQMIPMAAAGTVASWGSEDLNWTVIGLLLMGSLPGATLGPWLLQRVVGWWREDQ